MARARLWLTNPFSNLSKLRMHTSISQRSQIGQPLHRLMHWHLAPAGRMTKLETSPPWKLFCMHIGTSTLVWVELSSQPCLGDRPATNANNHEHQNMLEPYEYKWLVNLRRFGSFASALSWIPGTCPSHNTFSTQHAWNPFSLFSWNGKKKTRFHRNSDLKLHSSKHQRCIQKMQRVKLHSDAELPQEDECEQMRTERLPRRVKEHLQQTCQWPQWSLGFDAPGPEHP